MSATTANELDIRKIEIPGNDVIESVLGLPKQLIVTGLELKPTTEIRFLVNKFSRGGNRIVHQIHVLFWNGKQAQGTSICVASVYNSFSYPNFAITGRALQELGKVSENDILALVFDYTLPLELSLSLNGRYVWLISENKILRFNVEEPYKNIAQYFE